MSDLTSILLCADDFGLSPGISLGILKLVRQQRLSAVSCMANASDFSLYASDLVAYKDQVRIGLHFNLTEGCFLSNPEKHCFSLNELLIKSHIGWINSSFIAKEFNAQLDQFIQIIGCLPDFIDGHQHVHQFPIIRAVLLDLYAKRLKQNGSYIRSVYPSLSLPQCQIKTKILAFTGGKKLSRQLKQLGIPHNSYFSGIYDFATDSDYRSLFRQWLALAKPNTLIMCHPGDGLSPLDPIGQARQKEFDYFSSDYFVSDFLTASPKS